MAEAVLKQAEAKALFAMEKIRLNNAKFEFPDMGGSLSIPLVSADGRQNFLLDVDRGKTNLIKVTYQNRVRKIIILARLDIGGRKHVNPDGAALPCPHLHYYREGYGDKWAIQAPMDTFQNLTDIWVAFEDFMSYCNITKRPLIERGLFT
jgi:hypothetical protein